MFSTTPDELLALTGGREADLARDDGDGLPYPSMPSTRISRNR